MTTPGETGTLASALASLAEVEFRMGDWQAAYASAVESVRLAQVTGSGGGAMHGLSRLALVEAGMGRDEACRRHGEQALAMAARHADDQCMVLTRGALGLLELGLGHLDTCITWLERLGEGTSCAAIWTTDLAEALIRRGDDDRAAKTLDALSAGSAEALAFPVRRARERCRGLMASDEEFESHFVRALDCGLHVDEPFERARTELCFGQRLRRAGRGAAAEEHLRAALVTFERLGAGPWISMARGELEMDGISLGGTHLSLAPPLDPPPGEVSALPEASASSARGSS